MIVARKAISIAASAVSEAAASKWFSGSDARHLSRAAVALEEAAVAYELGSDDEAAQGARRAYIHACRASWKDPAA